MSKNNIIISIFGLAAISVVITEVILSGGEISRTESALFSALQFILSIAFAWHLAKESSQEEFEARQRKFAISAFRRIKEIEVQINHLLNRLDKAKHSEEPEKLHSLDIASVMAQSIHKTTQSSKLDWADIIGDQIESLEKIEYLQDIETEKEKERSGGTPISSQLNEKIEELKKSLSSELKLYASERDRIRPYMKFSQTLTENGYITLMGFVDNKWIGHRNPAKLFIGEVVTIKLGDYHERIASLCILDSTEQYIGSFINPSAADYDDFSMDVCQSIGATSFRGEITEIRNKKSNSNRTYFTVKCFPNTGATLTISTEKESIEKTEENHH